MSISITHTLKVQVCFSDITLKAMKKVSVWEVTNLLYFASNFPWSTVAK